MCTLGKTKSLENKKKLWNKILEEKNNLQKWEFMFAFIV